MNLYGEYTEAHMGEISLDNLTHNFATIRRQVGPKAQLLGVVKADAYGHGAVRVAKHLERLGAGYLAVSNLTRECKPRERDHAPHPDAGLHARRSGSRMHEKRHDAGRAEPRHRRGLTPLRRGPRGRNDEGRHQARHRHGPPRLPVRRRALRREPARHSADLTLPGLDVEGVFTHFCVSDEAADECVEFYGRSSTTASCS